MYKKEIAYKLEISDKQLKDNVKSILKANLSALGVLLMEKCPDSSSGAF